MTDDDFHRSMHQKLCDAADKLGEHFDNVIILATASAGSDTAHFSAGAGDVFARVGLAEMYLAEQKGYEQAKGAARWRRHCRDNDADPDFGD